MHACRALSRHTPSTHVINCIYTNFLCIYAQLISRISLIDIYRAIASAVCRLHQRAVGEVGSGNYTSFFSLLVSCNVEEGTVCENELVCVSILSVLPQPMCFHYAVNLHLAERFTLVTNKAKKLQNKSLRKAKLAATHQKIKLLN